MPQIALLRQRAFECQRGRCIYCNVPMWLKSPAELPINPPSLKAARHVRCTAEHLIARRDGGADVPANIAAACARCNHTRHKRKSPPQPDSFAEEVKKRVAKGRWHHAWIHEGGLLSPAPTHGAASATAFSSR
jgi:5-methylcytosine-specific restriction endonuclease McrA